jgi:predicted NodU family carbamoyl transferase
MLLDTSFNVKDQPIVNTPEESVETFLRTGIDCLFLENVLVACAESAPELWESETARAFA